MRPWTKPSDPPDLVVGRRMMVTIPAPRPLKPLEGMAGTIIGVYPGGRAAWIQFDDPMPPVNMPFVPPEPNSYLVYADQVVPLPDRIGRRP
jgi:hypothetical protein